MSSSNSLIHGALQEAYQRDLANSILKSDDADNIFSIAKNMIQTSLGWIDPECFHFEISVGATFGFKDDYGHRCMLKVFGPDCIESELIGRTRFQNWINKQGYPCPSVLVMPNWHNDLLFVIEEYLDKGRRANGHDFPDRKLMAHSLWTLIELGKNYPLENEIPTEALARVPNSPWPKPHNILFDFESTKKGAEWIDDVGERYGPVIDDVSCRKVIGHLDWGAKHSRIDSNTISAVYDWDSVARVAETSVVGGAAASFTTTWYVECDNRPDVPEMISFITEYQLARVKPFTTSECQQITASIYYAAAYGARCEYAGDQGQENANTETREFLKMLISVDLDGLLKQQISKEISNSEKLI
jgi:hypothetical protein